MIFKATLEIPVPRYIKKYLDKKYGSDLNVSRKSFMGLFLLRLLSEKHIEDFETKKIKTDCTYIIMIGTYYLEKIDFPLDKRKTNSFVYSMEQLFREDLFSHVDVSIKSNLFYYTIKERLLKHKATDAIKQFLTFYNIFEDDLALESIYRAYKRHTENNRLQKRPA